jgi:hypothetical protein
MLVNNGADVNSKLDYRQNLKHGIIEIAAIKQHIELLVYMNDKITDIPKRLIDLMCSEKIDDECRASVGGTIEKLSTDFPSIVMKLSKFKKESHEDRLQTLFDVRQIICYYTLMDERFGKKNLIFSSDRVFDFYILFFSLRQWFINFFQAKRRKRGGIS